MYDMQNILISYSKSRSFKIIEIKKLSFENNIFYCKK